MSGTGPGSTHCLCDWTLSDGWGICMDLSCTCTTHHEKTEEDPVKGHIENRMTTAEEDIRFWRERVRVQGLRLESLERRIDALEVESAGTAGEVQSLVYRLEGVEATQAVPETADSSEKPAPVGDWRVWVELPREVSAEDSVSCLLSWLSRIGWQEVSREEFQLYLGWIVALAERETGESDPDVMVEDGDWRVESFFEDFLLCNGDVNWVWVGDYASAWLKELCQEES